MKLTCGECGRVFEDTADEAVPPSVVFAAYHAHLDTHLLQSSIEAAANMLADAMEGDDDPDDPDDGEGQEKDPHHKVVSDMAGRFSRRK